MFNKRDKIQAFRSPRVTLLKYDAEKRTIDLSDGHLFRSLKVTVSFTLTERDDGTLWLAFSGDAITGYGEALARLMEVMWDQQLPSFGENEDQQLREQLSDSLQGDEPLCFRHMAHFVAGQPNAVFVVTEGWFPVDRM